MNNFLSITIISLLLISLSCSSSRKIKTIPDDQQSWDLCSICNGTGSITTLSSKNSSDDVSNNPGNKYAACLFPFSVFSALEDDKLTEKKTEKAYSRGYNLTPEKNIEVTKERVPERSIVKKQTNCPLCEGKGWTINNEEVNSPVIIKKKNELTDKDFINYK